MGGIFNVLKVRFIILVPRGDRGLPFMVSLVRGKLVMSQGGYDSWRNFNCYFDTAYDTNKPGYEHSTNKHLVGNGHFVVEAKGVGSVSEVEKEVNDSQSVEYVPVIIPELWRSNKGDGALFQIWGRIRLTEHFVNIAHV